MEQRQGPADDGVAQARQPAGLVGRQRLHVAADHFHEQQLADPEEHDVAARLTLAGLRQRELDQARQPAGARSARRGHARQSRQQTEERIERQQVASQKAAEHPEVRRPGVAVANRRRQETRGQLAEERLRVLDGLLADDPRRVRQRVAVAVRDDDDVARLGPQRGSVLEARPAAALRDHVIRDELLGAGQDARPDGRGARHFGPPRPRRLDHEEACAGQADRPQDGRERVGRQGLVGSGRIVKKAGRVSVGIAHSRSLLSADMSVARDRRRLIQAALGAAAWGGVMTVHPHAASGFFAGRAGRLATGGKQRRGVRTLSGSRHLRADGRARARPRRRAAGGSRARRRVRHRHRGASCGGSSRAARIGDRPRSECGHAERGAGGVGRLCSRDCVAAWRRRATALRGWVLRRGHEPAGAAVLSRAGDGPSRSPARPVGPRPHGDRRAARDSPHAGLWSGR